MLRRDVFRGAAFANSFAKGFTIDIHLHSSRADIHVDATGMRNERIGLNFDVGAGRHDMHVSWGFGSFVNSVILASKHCEARK